MPARLTTREAFLESVLHDEHVILGRAMLPFCLEMWCILEALQSPLITGEPILIEDLQTAVIACSTSSTAEFYRLTRRPGFWQSIWKIQTRTKNAQSVLDQFNRYIDDFVPQFPRWDMDGNGECKCPPIFICAAKLIDRGHTDHEVSRVIPLGKILSWGLAIDESKGDPLDSIQTELEMEALRELERREMDIRQHERELQRQRGLN